MKDEKLNRTHERSEGGSGWWAGSRRNSEYSTSTTAADTATTTYLKSSSGSPGQQPSSSSNAVSQLGECDGDCEKSAGSSSNATQQPSINGECDGNAENSASHAQDVNDLAVDSCSPDQLYILNWNAKQVGGVRANDLLHWAEGAGYNVVMLQETSHLTQHAFTREG